MNPLYRINKERKRSQMSVRNVKKLIDLVSISRPTTQSNGYLINYEREKRKKTVGSTSCTTSLSMPGELPVKKLSAARPYKRITSLSPHFFTPLHCIRALQSIVLRHMTHLIIHSRRPGVIMTSSISSHFPW